MMSTHKNLMTVCCAAVLAFGLAACGSSSDDDNGGHVTDGTTAPKKTATRRPTVVPDAGRTESHEIAAATKAAAHRRSCGRPSALGVRKRRSMPRKPAGKPDWRQIDTLINELQPEITIDMRRWRFRACVADGVSYDLCRRNASRRHGYDPSRSEPLVSSGADHPGVSKRTMAAEKFAQDDGPSGMAGLKVEAPCSFAKWKRCRKSWQRWDRATDIDAPKATPFAMVPDRAAERGPIPKVRWRGGMTSSRSRHDR